jgi:hypothetical protein
MSFAGASALLRWLTAPPYLAGQIFSVATFWSELDASDVRVGRAIGIAAIQRAYAAAEFTRENIIPNQVIAIRKCDPFRPFRSRTGAGAAAPVPFRDCGAGHAHVLCWTPSMKKGSPGAKLRSKDEPCLDRGCNRLQALRPR